MDKEGGEGHEELKSAWDFVRCDQKVRGAGMIAIIDYDAGNLRSVEKALIRIGGEPVITRDPGVILGADHVILPGVGSFGDAMRSLTQYGLIPVLQKAVEENIPFLGICLGLQLLFEGSEESPGVEGLSLLKGMIRRIPSDGPVCKGAAPSGKPLKIPHMGWNSLHFDHPGRLFAGLEEGTYVYFVHSYYLEAADPQIVTASAFYGTDIHASVEKGNLFACQFHPEKSSDAGMKILENFLQIRRV